MAGAGGCSSHHPSARDPTVAFLSRDTSSAQFRIQCPESGSTYKVLQIGYGRSLAKKVGGSES